MTISDEMVERGAIRLAELELGHGIWPTLSEGQKLVFNFQFNTALTAALQGSVVVPAELTEAMRYAAWKAQGLRVGASEAEAVEMTIRHMTENQRKMDQAAYAAMLAASQVSRHERLTARYGG